MADLEAVLSDVEFVDYEDSDDELDSEAESLAGDEAENEQCCLGLKRHSSNDFGQKASKMRKFSHPVIGEIGYSAAQGRRSTMEDTIRVEESLGDCSTFYCGVFDGHNGSETSALLEDRFHVVLEQMMKKNENVASGIKEAFATFDLELLQLAREDRLRSTKHQLQACKMKRFFKTPTEKEISRAGFNSGSTGTILVARDKTVYVGWLGDSRAVLGKSEKKAHPLTVDHRASYEAERIKECGGVVSPSGKLFHSINLSRAFGSFKHKMHRLDVEGDRVQVAEEDKEVQKNNPLSAIPEVVCFQPGSDDQFIILASDGIWDVLSNERAVEIVSKALFEDKLDPYKAADALVKKAVNEEKSTDNCSAIVVLLSK